MGYEDGHSQSIGFAEKSFFDMEADSFPPFSVLYFQIQYLESGDILWNGGTDLDSYLCSRV